MDVAVPLSYQGGVGSGSLPTANYASYDDAEISSKKMYAVCQIDREAIKAAENDEGAFVRMTKHVVSKTVESWMRNMSRALFNDGTGALGVSTAANAGGSATAPTIVISAATWNEANWEEKDYVMINSSNNAYSTSAIWEITAVAPSTRTITLSRISGSVDLTADAAAKTVYMQYSKDNDPEGIKGICDATSSTKYNISIARRWQSYQLNASSAGLTTDYMNQCMLGIEKQCGKVPNLIVTSYTQYRKLLNQLEDQKQYIVEPRSPELKGKVSFKGVEFMSTMGPVGVFADRFVDEDRMYFLNDNYMTIYHRPGFGWFDDDGTVFLRNSSEDAYDARYGGYLQMYMPPSFHGVLYGLAT
jgi:hypothetical protein